MSGRIWAMGAGLAVLVLAGCGGSSSTGGTGSGTEATTVMFKFTGATPTAVAAKIGSGSFTAVTPAATVTVEVPSGTTDFSVAYVCPVFPLTIGLNTVNSIAERVVNANTADGVSYTEACAAAASNATVGTLTASMDARALPGTTTVELMAASGSFSKIGAGTGAVATNLSLSVPAGNYRVGVLAYDYADVQSSGAGAALTGARFFENQTVPGALNGGDPVVLTSADATVSEPLAFNNVPAGYEPPFVQVSCMPAGQKTSVLMTTAATASYPMLPVAVAQSGDAYQVLALAQLGTGSSQSSGFGLQIVGVQETLLAAGPVSIAFPAAWGYAGPAAAALPTFSYSYAGFSGSSKMVRTGSISWTAAGQAQSSIAVTATPAYQGGVSTLPIPDLTGLTGFTASPASGTEITWIASLSSGAAPASDMPVQTVESMGTFLVP